MNAKRAKRIRRAFQLVGIDVRHRVYNVKPIKPKLGEPSFGLLHHAKKLRSFPDKYYPVINPLFLDPLCGRAKYHEAKNSSI